MATMCPTCSGQGRVQIQRAHNMEDNPSGPEYEEQPCTAPGCQHGWIQDESR